MALAEILDSNPQEFIMEAYADPLKYYAPDPPNETNPKEALEKIVANDKATKDVNLNNLPGIDEHVICEIFDGLRTNDSLVRLSAANCDVSDYSGATLNLAIENNQVTVSLTIKELNPYHSTDLAYAITTV